MIDEINDYKYCTICVQYHPKTNLFWYSDKKCKKANSKDKEIFELKIRAKLCNEKYCYYCNINHLNNKNFWIFNQCIIKYKKMHPIKDIDRGNIKKYDDRLDKFCKFCQINTKLTNEHWIIINNSFQCKTHNNIRRAKYKEKINKNQKKRYHNDINFKISSILRTRFSKILNNKKLNKQNSILKYLNCSLDEFKIHIEKLFLPKMSWNNYGKWHLDHIIPTTAFDFSDIENLYICFNYLNFQPLWSKDNISKGGANKQSNIYWKEQINILKRKMNK